MKSFSSSTFLDNPRADTLGNHNQECHCRKCNYERLFGDRNNKKGPFTFYKGLNKYLTSKSLMVIQT